MRALALALLLAFAPALALAQAYNNGQTVNTTPTSTAGGITVNTTQLSANTSTQIAPADPNRIALEIQCDTGGVSVSLQGLGLAGASVGNGTKFIPSGSAAPLYTPPVATKTAITAYTATAQTCTVTGYAAQ
jgi:hypothetical protein